MEYYTIYYTRFVIVFSFLKMVTLYNKVLFINMNVLVNMNSDVRHNREEKAVAISAACQI